MVPSSDGSCKECRGGGEGASGGGGGIGGGAGGIEDSARCDLIEIPESNNREGSE